MGTWGTGFFENDEALDFIDGLCIEHSEKKGKEDFLFTKIKKTLKDISTSAFLDIQESTQVEVSAYIFSRLINRNEKKIEKSLKILADDFQNESKGNYLLDLSKTTHQIITEVDDEDLFISTETYIELVLYKNKGYNIGETFLYRLLRQLYNVLSGQSETYEEYLDGNIEDSEFQKWFSVNKKVFKDLKKGLKNKKNIERINKKESTLSRKKGGDGEKPISKKDSYIKKIQIRLEKIKIIKEEKKSGLISEEEYSKKLKDVI